LLIVGEHAGDAFFFCLFSGQLLTFPTTVNRSVQKKTAPVKGTLTALTLSVIVK
jgi:hypothetical protein